MKKFDDEFSIYSWMRNSNTVEFLGVWEQLHNPDFKPNEFVTFKNEAGSNSFNLTPKKWINATNAIGMGLAVAFALVLAAYLFWGTYVSAKNHGLASSLAAALGSWVLGLILVIVVTAKLLLG